MRHSGGIYVWAGARSDGGSAKHERQLPFGNEKYVRPVQRDVSLAASKANPMKRVVQRQIVSEAVLTPVRRSWRFIALPCFAYKGKKR